MINFFEAKNAPTLPAAPIADESLMQDFKKTKFYEYASKGLSYLKKILGGTMLWGSAIGFQFMAGVMWGNAASSYDELLANIKNILFDFSTGNPNDGIVTKIIAAVGQFISIPGRLIGTLVNNIKLILNNINITTLAKRTGLCVLCAIVLIILYKVGNYFYAKWKRNRRKDLGKK